MKVTALGVVLTPTMFIILMAANGLSLPGDGLRIKGSGRNRSARLLEGLGLVRVAATPGEKSRVHVTEQGRRWCEERQRTELLVAKEQKTDDG